MSAPAVIHRARRVVTLDPAFPQAEAVAVRGDRILGIGSVDDQASVWGALRVDETFADSVLLPGFLEAHSHFLEGAIWAWEYAGYFSRLGPDGARRQGCQTFDQPRRWGGGTATHRRPLRRAGRRGHGGRREGRRRARSGARSLVGRERRSRLAH